MTMFNDPSAGENPPYGASINYWLEDTLERDVKIIVKTADGKTVRTLDGTKDAGINRIWWDLRGERSTEIKLRTKPLYADWIELSDKRTRSHPVRRVSVLMPPGTYNLTLQVGDQEYTQELQVLKDPHSKGTEEDIRLQTEMMLELHKDMSALADSINRIEWIRRQLRDLQAVAKELAVDPEAMVSNADELAGTFVTLEGNMLQLRATGTGQDFARWPVMLAGKIAYLAGAVAVADFRPVDQHREVHQLLKEKLQQYHRELDELLENELPAFNQTLEENNLPRIVAGRESPSQ